MQKATGNAVRNNLIKVIAKMSKPKEHYSIRKLFLEYEADYYMIFGERSDGKTFSVFEFAIWAYALFGYNTALIRRYDEDFKGKRGSVMFNNLINEGVVEKATDGKWTDIYYYSARWYFCKYENDKRILDAEPFCYAFSLSAGEHDKSTSYPKVKIILFDEFIARNGYLNDEFILFTNTLSTIIRERGDAHIFMCGNVINKFNPYFSEMGLVNARKMEQGKIDLYQYGENGDLKVAVQRTGVADKKKRKSKESDKYFAFDNPKLQMITTGAWELAIYPHLPFKYKSNDILLTYFIQFKEYLMQCEIIQIDNNIFTYVHRKTTDLQNKDTDIIFTPEYNPNINYRRRLTKPTDEIGKKIFWFFKNEKVFYQDNEVGEVVRNYILWSNTDKGII